MQNSAAFFGIGHNGGPPLDPGVGMAAILLEKGACPRLENTAARDRARPSDARRGVGISYREYAAVLLDTGRRL